MNANSGLLKDIEGARHRLQALLSLHFARWFFIPAFFLSACIFGFWLITETWLRSAIYDGIILQIISSSELNFWKLQASTLLISVVAAVWFLSKLLNRLPPVNINWLNLILLVVIVFVEGYGWVNEENDRALELLVIGTVAILVFALISHVAKAMSSNILANLSVHERSQIENAARKI